VDLVGSRAVAESFSKARGHGTGQIAERSQRARDRKVVAGSEERPRAGLEVPDEPLHERRLADTRLTADEDGPPSAAGGYVTGRFEGGQCSVALQELHG
jgi:hypothetical protein